MKKKVAAYCRVSTKEELQQYSLESQKEYYKGDIVWRCADRVEKGDCKAEMIKQIDNQCLYR